MLFVESERASERDREKKNCSVQICQQLSSIIILWLTACSHKSLLNHSVEFTVYSDTNGSVPAKCYLYNASTLFTVMPYTSPKSKTSLIWKGKKNNVPMAVDQSKCVCVSVYEFVFVSVLACLCIFRCAHFLGLSSYSCSYRSNCKVNKNSANETSV